jgi:hypothetical protein
VLLQNLPNFLAGLAGKLGQDLATQANSDKAEAHIGGGHNRKFYISWLD